MVASTWYHVAVLLADGTVRTFGYNNVGQLGVNDTTQRNTPVQVWGISSSATAVACGRYHTAILLADGTVRVFGENNRGQLGVGDVGNRYTPVQVFGISSSATAIAGGGNHTAILLADGSMRRVGYNNFGQLGVADTVSRRIPVKVGVSGNKVGSGRYHTAVVSNDGTVRTFGNNSLGQLGLGDTTNRLTPVQVTGLTSAIATAGGAIHTAVLLADGTVRTFGYNSDGELGVNDNTQRNTPVTVLTITSATAVAAGLFFTAVLLADGTVRTFGENLQGQLGINVTQVTRQTPVQVFGISSSATAVACGGTHAAVLLADGTVRTFGSNQNGQLGINVDGGTRQTPVQVFGISSSAIAVACGGYHTAILLADGTVRTFGKNPQGALGVNDTNTRQTPVQVFGISSSGVAVACGMYHTAVILADGTVRTFGSNNQGGLGVNDTTQRNTPVQVFGISSSATAVACGWDFTAVLLADGTVRTVGRNDSGQLGVNDTTSRLTPVQVITGFTSMPGKVAGGFYHTAVILADGTVRTFGRNTEGQLGVNDTTQRNTPVQIWGISSSATALASGVYHTVVLLADGTVRTVGGNINGALGVNDTTTRLTPVTVLNITSATAVASGRFYTAVLLSDGTVRTFGDNQNGQLGINVASGSRLTPVQVFGISSSATALACGTYHTAVILADGTVRTVGKGGNGQLGDNGGTQRNTPVQVWGISSSAVAVAAGESHTAVLLADGTVRTFGNGQFGQLGINVSSGNYLTPVQVWGISSSATAVACGDFHTAVLLADRTVRTFGTNLYGQLGVNDTTQRNTPVQVLNISTATAVAGGYYFTAILLANGTVRTFGRNEHGQLGVNDTTNRLTPVQVLNITTAVTPAPNAFLTNATPIVTPLTSASTPVIEW
jgi:alpha-tubulin suppressor-like RCC1 family protein